MKFISYKIIFIFKPKVRDKNAYSKKPLSIFEISCHQPSDASSFSRLDGSEQVLGWVWAGVMAVRVRVNLERAIPLEFSPIIPAL